MRYLLCDWVKIRREKIVERSRSKTLNKFGRVKVGET